MALDPRLLNSFVVLAEELHFGLDDAAQAAFLDKARALAPRYRTELLKP